MISYEASKWYIKLWRMRWYFYAIFLLIKYAFDTNMLIHFFIHNELDEKSEEKINYNWKLIKRHVELSKMCKYSSRDERTD